MRRTISPLNEGVGGDSIVPLSAPAGSKEPAGASGQGGGCPPPEAAAGMVRVSNLLTFHLFRSRL